MKNLLYLLGWLVGRIDMMVGGYDGYLNGWLEATRESRIRWGR